MALLLGATPVFVGLISVVVGLETLARAFWIGALVTFAGVALVAAGAGGGLEQLLGGDLLAIATAVTWAAYTVSIAPLMRRYSPYRISAVVLALGWVPLASLRIAAARRAVRSRFGWKVWLGFGYAVVGPLFLTNILWFTAIDRVGPSRAALFGNLQPFFAVFFALVLLSETLHGARDRRRRPHLRGDRARAGLAAGADARADRGVSRRLDNGPTLSIKLDKWL